MKNLQSCDDIEDRMDRRMFLCKLKESFEDNSSEEMEEKCF